MRWLGLPVTWIRRATAGHEHLVVEVDAVVGLGAGSDGFGPILGPEFDRPTSATRRDPIEQRAIEVVVAMTTRQGVLSKGLGPWADRMSSTAGRDDCGHQDHGTKKELREHGWPPGR